MKRRGDQVALINEAREYVWDHILIAPEAETLDRLESELMDLIPTDEEPGFVELTACAQDGLIASLNPLPREGSQSPTKLTNSTRFTSRLRPASARSGAQYWP